MFFKNKKEPINYDELATIFQLYMERNMIPDSNTDRIIIQALTAILQMTDTQSSPLDKYTFYERGGGINCDDMNYKLETYFGSGFDDNRKSVCMVRIGGIQI